MKLKLAVLYFIAGTVSASFFLCIGGRIAQNEDWIRGRSRCDVCCHPLGARDLIPLVSWILLKGRCRYCKAKISVSCWIFELLLGIGSVLALQVYGPGMESLRWMVLSGLLLGLSAVDLKRYEIPDGFILAGILFWLVTVPFAKEGPADALRQGLLGGVLIAGGMLGTAGLMELLTGRECLGGGDVKLLFMTGLYLGPACGFFSLILSCLSGTVFAAVSGRSKIPFGPFISFAVCVSLLFGRQAVLWYSGFLL